MPKIILKESDYLQTALKNLRPDTPNWYGWAKTDSSGNRIPDDQRMCWEHTIVIQDGVTKPSESEVNTEVQRLKDEYSATEYQRQRATVYPSIQEQLDMQYWDKVNGTTTWQDAIAKVKTDIPKE